MKAKRTLILVSGIILAIGAFSSIILALVAIIGAQPIIDLFQSASRMEYQSLVDAGQMLLEDMIEALEWERMFYAIYVYTFGISSLITGVLSGVFGGLLIAHSRKSDEIVATKKALIITSLVYAILLGNIIVIVLLICALIQKCEQSIAKEVNVEPANIVEVQPTDETGVDHKIKQLNILKETGAITQEEYVKLLKRIWND